MYYEYLVDAILFVVQIMVFCGTRTRMAAKKRSRGRPKLPKGKDQDVVVTIRLRAADRAKLQKVAKKADMAFSAWAREALLEKADLG